MAVIKESKIKTLDDLFEEIEQAKGSDGTFRVHYYKEEPGLFPIKPGTRGMDVVSLEFGHNISAEKVYQVFEHIKNTYCKVIYDARLITYSRIHIYFVKTSI